MTSTLKIVNNFFRMTLPLTVIHHHTKFGKKWLAVQEILSGHDWRRIDRTTDGQSDSNMNGGGGGYNKKG